MKLLHFHLPLNPTFKYKPIIMGSMSEENEDVMTVTIKIDGISHMRDMFEAIYSAGISHHESGRAGFPIPMPNIQPDETGQHIGGREINTDVEHNGSDTFGDEVLCQEHDYVIESNERGVTILRCRECNAVTTISGNIVPEENFLDEEDNGVDNDEQS